MIYIRSLFQQQRKCLFLYSPSHSYHLINSHSAVIHSFYDSVSIVFTGVGGSCHQHMFLKMSAVNHVSHTGSEVIITVHTHTFRVKSTYVVNPAVINYKTEMRDHVYILYVMLSRSHKT